jgi:hypothetical protein
VLSRQVDGNGHAPKSPIGHVEIAGAAGAYSGDCGEFELKGIRRPLAAYRIVSLAIHHTLEAREFKRETLDGTCVFG